MMRIAVAGSGGLARIFAQYLDQTVHTFIILSRQPRPALVELGYQVAVVDYDSQADLRYTLRGVDMVISTVSGGPQISLIDAAAQSGVRRFVPAEFEGPPGRRGQNDPLDRGSRATIARLREWSHNPRHQMRFTIFTCGIFYERFARGGLAAYDIGSSTSIQNQGSYLMDVGAGTAEVVEYNSSGQPIYICLTSVYDLARFVVAAIDIGPHTWPPEYRLQGDRRSVTQILEWGAAVRGVEMLLTDIIEPGNLGAHLEHATYYQDWAKAARVQELMATEQRRYDFAQPTLNPLVNIVPVPFWDWLSNHWGT
ncbi:Uncharacterized protein BP5553_03331 [Venustampulla echinocandica]|uniref:NAD(P)-binding domain-containing protein n=1 Tax=Venustampulla echinocandica TaxID=2656787 RepID=A0A370TTY6_9HELO|nr:Uncharacterized protein BP5553_03331 [Venustampulla echinocandica]RDL38991.1 Uncharacterized protein BP5553_03331 [Venustampulla echinocandica]